MADEVGLECEEVLDDGVEEAKRLLLACPLVKDVQPLRDGSGWYATLWCRSAEVHPSRCSEQRQRSKTRTTDEACLRDLLELVNTKHSTSRCLEAAETARAAAAAEVGPSAPTDAFQAMQAARQVGPAVEKAAAAERLVAEARRALAALETQWAAANAALEAARVHRRWHSVRHLCVLRSCVSHDHGTRTLKPLETAFTASNGRYCRSTHKKRERDPSGASQSRSRVGLGPRDVRRLRRSRRAQHPDLGPSLADPNPYIMDCF